MASSAVKEKLHPYRVIPVDEYQKIKWWNPMTVGSISVFSIVVSVFIGFRLFKFFSSLNPLPKVEKPPEPTRPPDQPKSSPAPIAEYFVVPTVVRRELEAQATLEKKNESVSRQVTELFDRVQPVGKGVTESRSAELDDSGHREIFSEFVIEEAVSEPVTNQTPSGKFTKLSINGELIFED
jgi:hypothetical protein